MVSALAYAAIGPRFDTHSRVRNSFAVCHLSPVGRQITIENSVSNDFRSTFADSIDVFDCHLIDVFIVHRLVSLIIEKHFNNFCV